MELTAWIDRLMPEIVAGLAKCRECPVGMNTVRGLNLAGQEAIQHLLTDLISILFPGCHGQGPIPEEQLPAALQERLRSVALALKTFLGRALEYECRERTREDCDRCAGKAEDIVRRLVRSLPEIQAVLQEDIVAAYEGDPAAKSTMEVVMSYPGFYAVVVHRIAHCLYANRAPLIPRIMSEYAHSRTGIDIHPGARIGPGFFIDHGTGVVIGETCEIGRNVKIYQGVTLGSLSFEKDEHGRPIKGVKRHPNVEDNVVIYAGATILGGQTTIGADSVIGGNVWLTHSVPPGSKVVNRQPRPLIGEARKTAVRAGGKAGGDRKGGGPKNA